MNTRNKPQSPPGNENVSKQESGIRAAVNRDVSRVSGARYERPKSGNLKGDSITLLTVIAQQTWKGRAEPGKPLIIGFEAVLKRTRNMQGAMAEDPWADQTHTQMLKAIRDCNAQYIEMQKQIEALFPEQNDAITFEMPDLSNDLKPEHFSISFRSKIGWQLIELLVKADDLIVDIMTAERLGRLTAAERRDQVQTVQTKIRSVMGLISKWKYTGVTHRDVAENTEKAKEAIRKLGPLQETQQAEELSDQSHAVGETQSSHGLFKRLFGHFKKS